MLRWVGVSIGGRSSGALVGWRMEGVRLGWERYVLVLYRKRSGGTALEERSESHRPERFRYSDLKEAFGIRALWVLNGCQSGARDGRARVRAGLQVGMGAAGGKNAGTLHRIGRRACAPGTARAWRLAHVMASR